MQKTTNYQLKKPELTDTADITQLSPNWDKIDQELKKLWDEKFAITGGNINGAVTITSGGINATGDSIFNNNVTIKGATIHENPIRSTRAEFLQTQAPVVRGTPPESTTYNYWSVFDKNGWNVSQNRLAHIDYTVDTNGVASLAMYVNKYVAGSVETGAGIYARWNGETPIIALTHHPATNSNDYSIATTKWVQNKIAGVQGTKLVKW